MKGVGRVWTRAALALALGCVRAAAGCDGAEGSGRAAEGSAARDESETAGKANPASKGKANGPSGEEHEDEPAGGLPLLDRVLRAHGADTLRRARVEFDFRGDHFTVERNGGLYEYARTKVEDGKQIRDVLDNDGFRRFVDGQRVELADGRADKLKNGVNSVVYFALLPFALDDPAVQAERLDDVKTDGHRYARVRVRFAKEGGGTDHDDVYLYWFRKPSLEMDYFAYRYYTGEGGVRFRDAYDRREVGGVSFADYENYTVPETDVDPGDVQLTGLLERHLEDELKHVSTIELDNVAVEPLQGGGNSTPNKEKHDEQTDT